jgi:hypothetical protein
MSSCEGQGDHPAARKKPVFLDQMGFFRTEIMRCLFLTDEELRIVNLRCALLAMIRDRSASSHHAD